MPDEAVDLGSLEHESVLQETKSCIVSKVSRDGQSYALKQYTERNQSFCIESEFLASLIASEFRSLVLPEIVDCGNRHLLMTFVHRETQTRETICDRAWTADDIESVCEAIEEFQSISLSRRLFSVKQIVLGFNYPVVRAALVFAPALRCRLLSMIGCVKAMLMMIRYTMLRPFLRNRTVHYDLTTLNCAFTPDGRLSILDFEFPYYKGDSVFDVIYFITIPPRSIEQWTFQNSVLKRFVGRNPGFASEFRCRFILLVCCLSRAVHFQNSDLEQQAYIDSIDLLLDRRRFRSWWMSMMRA